MRKKKAGLPSTKSSTFNSLVIFSQSGKLMTHEWVCESPLELTYTSNQNAMLPPFMRKQHLQKLFLGWGQLIPGACAGCLTVMTRLQKVGPKIDLYTVSPMCRFYSLRNGQAECALALLVLVWRFCYLWMESGSPQFSSGHGNRFLSMLHLTEALLTEKTAGLVTCASCSWSHVLKPRNLFGHLNWSN